MTIRALIAGLLVLASPLGLQAAEFDPHWGDAGVFSDAQSCATCHRASTDLDPGISPVMRDPLTDTGTDVSPSAQWSHSVMAHAFDDPYFQAKVEDESTLFPALSGFIEDKCLSCHAPMARTNAHQANVDLTQDASCPLPDGCYRLDTAETQDHAREGVSCTLCHQIKADNLGTAASYSGGYEIAAAGDTDALTIYGPHPNPVTGAMTANTVYTPAFGSHMDESSHCATCHTLYTPTLDADTDAPTGNDFLEQAAFLEWANSVYTTGGSDQQACQDCHMPDPEPGVYRTRTAVQPNGNVNENWPERSPFFTHSMVGGNTYLLELLRDNRDELGIENSTTVAGFDAKIADTRALLENATADIAITRAQTDGDTLAIDVDIVNHTGHKLPTGYPSRRMWLHLTVRDAEGAVVFESGAVDANGHIGPDSERLAADCLAVDKPAGFDTAACYQPHFDVIDDDSQVALYETVLGDTNGDITHVLLHAAHYLKDNRIPPRGFTNNRADTIEPQTRPAGIGNDADFNTANATEGSGTDTVHYRIDLDDDLNGPYTIDARLLYQAIQPAFIDSMHTSAARVDRFKTMARQNPPSAETLATDSGVSTDSAELAQSSSDSQISGGGGGGCTLQTDTKNDSPYPLLLLIAAIYLCIRGLIACATLLRKRAKPTPSLKNSPPDRG